MSAVPNLTRTQAAYSTLNLPLAAELSGRNEHRALELLRAGDDTVTIAWKLRCTGAAAANGIANARERERCL